MKRFKTYCYLLAFFEGQMSFFVDKFIFSPNYFTHNDKNRTVLSFFVCSFLV